MDSSTPSHGRSSHLTRIRIPIRSSSSSTPIPPRPGFFHVYYFFSSLLCVYDRIGYAGARCREARTDRWWLWFWGRRKGPLRIYSRRGRPPARATFLLFLPPTGPAPLLSPCAEVGTQSGPGFGPGAHIRLIHSYNILYRRTVG
ncbi:hypothetical protein DENSPDRAFT_317436 [Dentipellis sp. KUC8613]|nr:hypothetical protein DENSPDRAFT_317436 [Dentipellis sp. KUC8613]